MKRIVSIIFAGALALLAASCVKDELKVFDASKATAPVLNSYEVGDDAISATYTPGVFKQGFNDKVAPNHAFALVSVDGQAVSKIITTSDKEGVLTVTAGNLAKALMSMGYEEGDFVDIEMAVRATLQDPSKDNGINGFVDSEGRISLSHYEIYIPTGNPYDRYTEESPWGLVGSFNGWGDGGTDFPMFSNGTLHVAKEVELPAGAEVKFRKDKSWDVNYGYGEGVESYTLDEEFAVAQGGPNIVIAESGVYYLVLDPEGKKAKVVAASTGDEDLPDIDLSSYEENEAMAGAETWGIIGPAVLDWNTDVDLEKVSDNPEIWAGKDIPFQQDKFKFRGNDEWADYDLGGAPEFALDTPLQLSKGGSDITAEAGVYNVYLYPTYMLVYITEGSGDVPPPPAKPKMWSLIGHVNGSNWDADFDLENVSGDKWVIKNVTVKEDDEFKIRADHEWSKSYGGPEENDQSTIEEGKGVYKPEIGTEFAAGDKNIRIGKEGAYNITLNYGDEPTILIEEYKEFPDALYMIGTDFGNWDWNSDAVVELVPVVHNPGWGADAEGQFWTIRYFTADNGFKFNSAKAWDGSQFGKLETNEGFTNDSDVNLHVPEDGFYMVHIDMKRSILHVEPARVYGIGSCFGGWDEGMEAALFQADGKTLKLTTASEGELRMYAASEIKTSDWWTREFIILDGKIDYRGDDEGQGDQARVNVLKGQVVTLDFNAGTGTITGEGEVPDKPEALSLVGTLDGSNWGKDFDLENVSGDKWVIKNVAIGEADEFKIRANHDWAKSYGGPEENDQSTIEEGKGVYKPEIGKEFVAGDKNIRIGQEGVYTITLNYGDEPTILIEEYKEFPSALYMTGTDFGGWDWNSDGVVELTPVLHNPDWGADAPGQFYTVRYLKAGNGFKINSARAWDGGQFGKLETNEGFTNDNDDNVQVAEDGVYMIHVDLKRSILHVEPAKVYGMGAAFGGWDEAMEDALFTAEDGKLSATVKADGDLRMYAASGISTSGWWTREFNAVDGKIVFRLMNELGPVPVKAGQKVTLDFNAGTAVVE